MKVQGQAYHTIWEKPGDPSTVEIIDQRPLPHRFVIEELTRVDHVVNAIRDMHVRGAPLIGAAAGYGMYLAALNAPEGVSPEDYFQQEAEKLKGARPTAINLAWAVDKQLSAIVRAGSKEERIAAAHTGAQEIVQEELERSKKIGEFGAEIIAQISRKKNGKAVNILTHCNAGWLACIDYGTATAPIYYAFDQGIEVHVWVDETRPRNQGARLTAWELGEHGVLHTVIADNTGGHLMQNGLVDLAIVGTDRTTFAGDVANKIGTYLKALAAQDNGVPFYVALPSSTIDWSLKDGKDIVIEERGEEEVSYIQGLVDGEVKKVLLTPPSSPAANYAFDVTPARLVTGLITERGICPATEEGIAGLFPEGGGCKRFVRSLEA